MAVQLSEQPVSPADPCISLAPFILSVIPDAHKGKSPKPPLSTAEVLNLFWGLGVWVGGMVRWMGDVSDLFVQIYGSQKISKVLYRIY